MELAIINGTYRDTTKPSAAVSQASAASRKLWDVCTAAYLCAVFGFRFHFLSRFQCCWDVLEFLVTAAWTGFSGLFGFFCFIPFCLFFFFWHHMLWFTSFTTTVIFLILPILCFWHQHFFFFKPSSFWLLVLHTFSSQLSSPSPLPPPQSEETASVALICFFSLLQTWQPEHVVQLPVVCDLHDFFLYFFLPIVWGFMLTCFLKLLCLNVEHWKKLYTCLLCILQWKCIS